jgi:hypothetical protein
MSTPSTSPERNTFQRDCYILHKTEEEKLESEQTQSIVEHYDGLNIQEDAQMQDPEWQKNNLEWDLRTTDWILDKARNNDVYAQNLYAALCNNDFVKADDSFKILKQDYWTCSWRGAGGVVANMLQRGDYIEWYCSGMGGLTSYDPDDERNTGHVTEGTVTEEIRLDIERLGWLVVLKKETK